MPAATSLPAWFWLLYYAFLILTFSVSIMAIIKGRNRILSIINIMLVLTVPLISFINSIGRSAVNEWQHLIIHLKSGSFWAIYAWGGYLFIMLWWILFFQARKPSVAQEKSG